MNCSEAERLFDAYLDGELSGSLRFEFDAHRLHCPMCQRKLAMMEACEHILVGDTRGPALSDDFTERVMSQVAIRGEQMRRSRHLKLYVGAAIGLQAAGVALFVFVWKAGQDRDVALPRTQSVANHLVDPKALDVAMGDRSGVLLNDLIFRALERTTSDVKGLSKLATNFSVPQEYPVFLGGDNDVADESTAPSASDPQTHHI